MTESISNKTLSSNDITKLKTVINEGVQVSDQVDLLKEGLRETVKAVAEELDIKPSSINRAIRIAFKADMDRKKEEFDEVEEILQTVGRYK